MSFIQQQGGYLCTCTRTNHHHELCYARIVLCSPGAMKLFHPLFFLLSLNFCPKFSLLNSQYQRAASKINCRCKLVPLIQLKAGKKTVYLSIKRETNHTWCSKGNAFFVCFYGNLKAEQDAGESWAVTSISQSELEAHTTLFVCQEPLHTPPVELLAAERTLTQSEGVGRVKYSSNRAIQLKPSTFKDMLSTEVGK